MTRTTALPTSLSDLDPDTESEPDLSRVTVLVGATTIDVGLPTNASISSVIHDVIDLAAAHIAARSAGSAGRLDNTEGAWTLAKVGGGPIDPNRSLAEVGIFDGDVLTVTGIGAPSAPLLFDDVENPDAASEQHVTIAWLIGNAGVAAWFALSLAAAVAAALLLPRQAGSGPATAIAAVAVGAVCAVVSCVLAYRSMRGAARWAAVALPLLFAGALYLVPGGHGMRALPMAFGLTGLTALLVLLLSRHGRPLYTAVIAASVLFTPAALAVALWDPRLRAVGTVLASASVIVVYLSPRLTIALAKLPIPRVPTAGEPLDDIDTHGGTAVDGVNAIGKQVIPTEEGMAERVRRANEYLTGILVAAAGGALVGSYLAVDVTEGFYWQGSAFAAAVAAVLCLRGRGHHDLFQSATLIGTGMVIALAAVVKTATFLESVRTEAALTLLALTVLVMWCGLVAPRREFSPVQRRLVEIAEYVAIGVLLPLCFWVAGVYAFFRELSL